MVFLLIAFIADQVSAFTEVRLNIDGSRVTNNRYCGLESLYSKNVEFEINPILTTGERKKWKYSNAMYECEPRDPDSIEAEAVCDAFAESERKKWKYSNAMYECEPRDPD